MNRESAPGFTRKGAHHDLSGLLIEPEERDLSLFYPIGIPFVAIIALLLFSPTALPWALPTMILSGALAFLATRDLKTAIATTGIAPLLFTSMTEIAPLLLLALLIPAAWLGTPLVLGAAAVAFILPAPHGGFLLAYAVALLVSWPHEQRPGPAHLFGLPANQLLDRLALGVALLLTLLSILFAPPAWAAPIGLIAGGLSRIIVRHPANARIGNAMVRVAAGLSVTPALFLFLLAALRRLPPVSENRVILLTWGLVGVGLLILMAGIGTNVLLRSTGPWSSMALSAILTATFLAIGATFLLGSTQGALPLGIGWALFAPWIALGATRLVLSYPKKPLFVWGSVTIIVAIAYGIHTI